MVASRVTDEVTFVNCNRCGDPFRTFPSTARPDGARFCSRACYNASHKVEVICDACGASLTIGKSKVKDRNYCSRHCYNKQERAKSVVELTCPNCNVVHYRPPSHAHKVHCSPSCASGTRDMRTPARVHTAQLEQVCERCGSHYYRKKKGRYCSRLCMRLSGTTGKIPRTDPMKCTGCLQYKSLTRCFQFIKTTGQYTTRCTECRALKGTTPEAKRRSHLRTRFRMTLEAWLSLYDEQGGACAICRIALPSKEDTFKPQQKRTKWSARNWNTDHCHITNKIRGILCRLCNQALGSLRDNPRIALACAAYLERHRVCQHMLCADGPSGECLVSEPR